MKKTYIPNIEQADYESLLYFSRSAPIWLALSRAQQQRVQQRIAAYNKAF